MRLSKENDSYVGSLDSFEMELIELENITVEGTKMSFRMIFLGDKFELEGSFNEDSFSGYVVSVDKKLLFEATRVKESVSQYSPPDVQYILSESDVQDIEKNIDHAGLIASFDRYGFERGNRIYNSNCINCHGNRDIEGSIPLSHKFWQQPFKAGNDPYSLYQTITRGHGSMPPQLTLTPLEKYDVIGYIREKFIKQNNANEYFEVGTNYLADLPKGTDKGPSAKPYHPWSDMDYGNFFINTYELVDGETGIPRYHSPGPSPYPDEDYLKNNFAYKGIAIRLDEGMGGVSQGNTWMIFDHDVMRVAGGWTGEGFIDWEGILLNDNHETYPRTIGELHFETPVGPGWANPSNGSFEDMRFKARDGRRFGPLPKKWANYKGLYHFEDKVILSYSVGDANILEKPGVELNEDQVIFTRTFNISSSSKMIKTRVAPIGTHVSLKGKGARIIEEDGYMVMEVQKGVRSNLKLFIANSKTSELQDFIERSPNPESLKKYTSGGPAHYPERLQTIITKGKEDGLIAVDQLTPPFDNPWKSRMKLSGIDFMADRNVGVLCTADGDVWKVTGLTEDRGSLQWKRIASGLFQPLGIKVLEEKIYVTCRDQIVRLKDLNGDEETDFYESFNHDHQVTDHFHEFAMGLQADAQGNLYYAKSGRHAREALIPQHGTLLKVSKDGSKTDIVATGFRAANGVCLNPDGSFIVTDQQGYWNPMNRVNWVEVDGSSKFYGNMWGYNPPDDTTRAAMEAPMVWVDMEFDRSPSELIWVDSESWGPLNGSLLSLSYGYGKIQLVLNEEVDGQRQGGVIDLPGIKFLTGVMRSRFNASDGHLYACGLSAWGTSQMMRGGEFYRLRYTGNPLPLPIALSAETVGIKLSFDSKLNPESLKPENFEIKTWDLVRSHKYGSDRYNVQSLAVDDVVQDKNGASVRLIIPDIAPIDVMTISYKVEDVNGNQFEGRIQNTIHGLKDSTIKELL